MKGFTGAQLLSVASALAGLAAAKQINKARLVENADMAAIPNMKMLQHGIELTQRGPHGGWRAYGSYRGGSGGGSTDVDVDVNLKATVTADVNVAGTVAATVQQVCAAGRTICSPGFCADLDSDVKNCGQCGFECPKYSTCDAGYDTDYPCECPDQFSCQRGDECHKPVCGDRCMDCPWDAQCDAANSKCICPAKKSKLCEPAGALAYCANIWGEDISDKKDDYDKVKRGPEVDSPGGDILNCGSCGYKCPQPDEHKNFGPAKCFPVFPLPTDGTRVAHCDCGPGSKLCEAGPNGLGVCAPYKNDYLCGKTCTGAENCANNNEVCVETLVSPGVYTYACGSA
ncbi:hypothetical protein QBC37DRAFT_374106 [Rhypophila decipiens]|uniref:Uncharacterized protein n=1 Tax=Rhypophila decipiens TaxID=261697 RepID=A0AAN6Y8S5_9PEZI|nr:hypothetical protein QBC37DRAFT_374106 [Rhypophila decipiens]